jgi:hypothetical protein
VVLEQVTLSLMSTIELRERKSSGSGQENRDYGHRHPLSAKKKFTLTSTTSDSHSVGIVRSKTQATEFSFFSLDLFGCDTT